MRWKFVDDGEKKPMTTSDFVLPAIMSLSCGLTYWAIGGEAGFAIAFATGMLLGGLIACPIMRRRREDRITARRG